MAIETQLEGDRNQVNQVPNQVPEVAKSQNQVPNQVPGSGKNEKPGTLPGTRNLTKKFWPYFLVRPKVTVFYKTILVVDNL